jgi:hypothetical protein
MIKKIELLDEKVCVCVCVRKRERERGRVGKRHKETIEMRIRYASTSRLLEASVGAAGMEAICSCSRVYLLP